MKLIDIMLGECPFVLYAEDDSAINQLLSEILRVSGFESQGATTGGTLLQNLAISLRERGKPSFVLLDVHLPGMSGIEVYGEMEKIGYRAPTIWTSADPQALKNLPVEIGPSSGQFWLPKPYADLDVVFGTFHEAAAWKAPAFIPPVLPMSAPLYLD